MASWQRLCQLRRARCASRQALSSASRARRQTAARWAAAARWTTSSWSTGCSRASQPPRPVRASATALVGSSPRSAAARTTRCRWRSRSAYSAGVCSVAGVPKAAASRLRRTRESASCQTRNAASTRSAAASQWSCQRSAAYPARTAAARTSSA
ncbi:hypothetical protein [Actinoplanes teichomyceticus]|uniref:hypothetical protein n=1 Tax=Actinoplanes teichomyceticus TaxID=1867 RepID=UPI00119CB8E2|nr:hypothetical protein [Actinoplanes teichomyceticus]